MTGVPLVRRAGVVALLGAVAALLAGPAAAVPATTGDLTDGQEITRYDVDVELGADGVATVSIDLDLDFGDDPGHGPYLVLPTRQEVDADHDRLYEISDVTASSPSGAPADLDVEQQSSALVLKIGDEDVDDVSGTQTYRVTYTVDGWVNPASQDHSGDELYWNVIGDAWEIPLSDVTVTVHGPADVQDALCFAGPAGSTDACTAVTSDGSTAVAVQGTVPVGDLLTVAVGWPAGTFPGVQPILVDPIDALAPVRPASVGGAVALLVLLGGAALVIVRVRRTGRDRAHLGLTPGLRPADGAPGRTGRRDRRAPVAVQLTPPDGVRVGEVGVLVDERADPVDVTATLIDLAVRGYLRIEEVHRKNPAAKAEDWTLVALRPADDDLLPFEVTLLARVFDHRDRVRLSDLRTTFASAMAEVQKRMYAHVTEVGWFREDPQRVRRRWIAAGSGLLVLGGLGALVPLAGGWQLAGSALVPLAVAVIGVLVMAVSGAAPARTADGTAVLAQALGFRRYLATAEADQIRFEEGQDVFSRYLPYAIVFGLTDRWARVFADLAAQGRVAAEPGWYVGSHPVVGVYWVAGFASSMDRFQSVASSAIAAPTPGSGGSSGLGGGGFSGGGVGGGGGGGW
ncbi:MAG TPA: DUF2207 domain-containing protein [Cellulomonas sp.]